MIQRKLLWSDRSLADYRVLADYLLEEWGKTITQRISQELYETVIKIHLDPELYPVYIKKGAIRRCVFSNQMSILFKVTKDLVEIVALFDNRQDPKKLRKL